MREIKFRAWWKHPKYLPDGAMFFVGGMIFATPQDGEPEYENCSIPKQIGLMDSVDNSKIGWNDAKECVLMQYTGLKDKNGVEDIYEGDIIDSEGLIIGNIYESPQVYKEGVNHIIAKMGTRAWRKSESVAMGCGCEYAE